MQTPFATFTFETAVTRTRGNRSNGAEYEIGCEVEYRVLPAIRATAITPAEPESIEIVNVKTDGGIDLTEAEYDDLQEQAEADAVDAIADHFADAADYRRDCRDERRAA